jgi:cyclic pyranopterin phosphate synthase
LPTSNVLTYEDILRIIGAGRDLGIGKVRITGGEPLVRKGLVPFLDKLSSMKGINDVAITTNGLKLGEFLHDFKKIGIRRLNVSLDSLNRKSYEAISGTDGFNTVWKNVMNALDMGFHPVKINMVVLGGMNDHEIPDFANLTRSLPLHVRFIEYMPCEIHRLEKNRQVLGGEIKRRAQQGEYLLPVTEKDNSSNSERFVFPGAAGELGFINPVSRHFCRSCNRLRLTADGLLKPCLLSDLAVDIGKSAKAGLSEKHLQEDFVRSAKLKPGCSQTDENVDLALPRLMSAIGG